MKTFKSNFVVFIVAMMALFSSFAWGEEAEEALSASAGSGAGVGIALLIWLAVIVLLIAGSWKIFTKAGKPGWAVLVPIYNLIVMFQIVGRPLWWIVLFFVPFVNLVVAVILCIDLAKRFGKDVGYGLGLAFLGFIFIPMLGFSDAQYTPPTSS